MILMIPIDVYNPLIFVLLCNAYSNRMQKVFKFATNLKVMYTLFQATHLGLPRKILTELGKPQCLVAQ